MDTKKKLFISLGALASIGGITFIGYHIFKSQQVKKKIMKALWQQRYLLSWRLVKYVELHDENINVELEKGITTEEISANILNSQQFIQLISQIREESLKNVDISEKEYIQAINVKFKNDKDIQSLVGELKNAVILASRGIKNYFDLKSYPKFTFKECIKHSFKKTLFLISLSKEEFLKQMIAYSKEEGFFVDDYHPIYILFINYGEHKEQIQPAIELIGEIARKRMEQAMNLNQKFDDEKDLLGIYEQLGIKD